MISVAVVIVFAIVQSVFGVGLLLFGTPTLVLLGMPFREVLATLLPASMAISALQLGCAGQAVRGRDIAGFALWALPALVLSLTCRLTLDTAPKIDLLLAALLLLTACLRHASRLATTLQRVLAARQWLSLVTIGAVHGFTNMGGAVLSMFASIRHRDKARITAYVALGYLMLAGSQLVVLLALHAPGAPWPSLWAPIVAAVVYLLVGRRVWAAVQHHAYQLALSGFMVLCAGVIALRTLA